MAAEPAATLVKFAPQLYIPNERKIMHQKEGLWLNGFR
jgi:hypothetical protein